MLSYYALPSTQCPTALMLALWSRMWSKVSLFEVTSRFCIQRKRPCAPCQFACQGVLNGQDQNLLTSSQGGGSSKGPKPGSSTDPRARPPLSAEGAALAKPAGAVPDRV